MVLEAILYCEYSHSWRGCLSHSLVVTTFTIGYSMTLGLILNTHTLVLIHILNITYYLKLLKVKPQIKNETIQNSFEV